LSLHFFGWTKLLSFIFISFWMSNGFSCLFFHGWWSLWCQWLNPLLTWPFSPKYFRIIWGDIKSLERRRHSHQSERSAALRNYEAKYLFQINFEYLKYYLKRRNNFLWVKSAFIFYPQTKHSFLLDKLWTFRIRLFVISIHFSLLQQ